MRRRELRDVQRYRVRGDADRQADQQAGGHQHSHVWRKRRRDRPYRETGSRGQQNDAASKNVRNSGAGDRADGGANQHRAHHQLYFRRTEAERWPDEKDRTRDHPGVVTEQAAANGSHGRCEDDETRHVASLARLPRTGTERPIESAERTLDATRLRLSDGFWPSGQVKLAGLLAVAPVSVLTG